jgi:hypothetical protein
MAEMGNYCKAYLVKDLRAFSQWKENTENLSPGTVENDGREEEVERNSLNDDDVLYLQENFIVTDGIFKDENIVYDNLSDEWKVFCQDKLGFEIPDYVQEIMESDVGAEVGTSDAVSEKSDEASADQH